MSNTYPLIRVRWSNEHIMAALFVVLLLYLLPFWIGNPAEIASFLAVLAFSLLLDTVCGFLRHKRPVCSVSAAVTAGILQVLTPGIPLWGRLLGVFAAIILGKQIWGGTGKNIINPAILGYFLISMFFNTSAVSIEATLLLIPAMILSVPFILFRPFTALSYFVGVMAAFWIGGMAMSVTTAAFYVFLGSIVLTDPVTVTPLKLPGILGGFAAALLPFFTPNSMMFFALVVLALNLFSYLAEEYSGKPREKRDFSGITFKSPYKGVDYASPAIDLSGNGRTGISEVCACTDITGDELTGTELFGTDKAGMYSEAPSSLDAGYTSDFILERIKRNEVYGMGGGAFPTVTKLADVISSGAENKYLVVNAAECDPGLIHDKWILKNRVEDVFKGIELISRCIGFKDEYIAVKAGLEFNCPGDMEASGVKISRVKNFYPAGYEKALIQSVLGIDVPDGSIPSRLGILVINVQTLLAVHEAVSMDKKADSKYITVSDLKNGTAKTVRVSLGSRIADTIESIYPGSFPVFTGGGIMQSHIAEDDEPVGKNTNFITVSSMPRYKESPFCSNCDACRINCPKGLAVNRIAQLTELGKFDETKQYQPEKCIRCGLCSYVCLAGKNLSARVAEAKEKVLL